jgi:hypothetical protein
VSFSESEWKNEEEFYYNALALEDFTLRAAAASAVLVLEVSLVRETVMSLRHFN